MTRELTAELQPLLSADPGPGARREIAAFTVLLTLGVFVADLLTPRGVAVSTLYGGAVFAAFFTGWRHAVPVTATASLTLVITGGILTADNAVPVGIGYWNRGLGLAVIGAAWFFGNRLLNLSRDVATYESRFRVLVDSILEYGIIMLDQNGNIAMWSRGAEAVFGYSEKQMLGRSPLRFLPEGKADARDHANELAQAAADGRLEREGWRVRKDGTRFWANYVIVPLRAENRLVGFAQLTRDLTERKRSEMQLQKYMDDLAKSNADLQQFAYVASHDLQEPLRAVSGCVQLLQKRYREKLDDRADELIKHVVDGAARMQRLINDLLDYSRIATRGRNFEETDVQAPLDRAIENLQTAINESGAVVTHGSLPTVRGDHGQLTQLFQNLIANAIKFRGKRSPIVHVSAEHTDGGWRFTVSDNGIGIEKEFVERIFGIFQRLHTRSEYEGSGIGLSICRKIVERHGGKIWVESEPGSGSNFHFILPEQGVEA